jgi:hypothetical protein
MICVDFQRQCLLSLNRHVNVDQEFRFVFVSLLHTKSHDLLFIPCKLKQLWFLHILLKELTLK